MVACLFPQILFVHVENRYEHVYLKSNKENQMMPEEKRRREQNTAARM